MSTSRGKFDSVGSYRQYVDALLKDHSHDQAMRLAVGKYFEPLGVLERELLVQWGMREDSYLIDVGCGSGRLALALAGQFHGQYLGLDVIPELVEYARNNVGRPDWRFLVTNGSSIPAEDGQADMVCFFSVFTHLLHEQSFVYLREAKRVLKPSGRIVFSYFDFAVPAHWEIFKGNIEDIDKGKQPLNMFIGQDAIRAWASQLELEILHLQPGDQPHIPLSEPVSFPDGAVMEGKGKLGLIGQSVCVLSRP